MCCCLRNRNRKRLLASYNDEENDNDNNTGDDVQLLDLANSNNDNFDPQMTLNRKSVTLDKVIGEGNFGKVFSGTAKDPQRGNVVVAVAVKSPSAGARIEFEAEMEIMGQLTRLGGHQHIVSVVGCVYGNEPLLVLELCAGGSLKTALTASKKASLAQATAPTQTVAAAAVFADGETKSTTFYALQQPGTNKHLFAGIILLIFRSAALIYYRNGSIIIF